MSIVQGPMEPTVGVLPSSAVVSGGARGDLRVTVMTPTSQSRADG